MGCRLRFSTIAHFLYESNTKNYIQKNHFFFKKMKNNYDENIFRQKTFYVETLSIKVRFKTKSNKMYNLGLRF
jgi:hypothetical protein